MTEEQLTPEQIAYLSQVYNVSISISQKFKDMLETAIKTNNTAVINPFLQHILRQCDDQAAAAHKKKSSIITLDEL